MDSGIGKQAYAIESGGARRVRQRYSALSAFRFENGYKFSATDLGNQGVKIDLIDREEVAGAIILPPKKVHECGRWLLNTLGQDRMGLPKELISILERLSREKKLSKVLMRGDKKKIKDALRVLKS